MGYCSAPTGSPGRAAAPRRGSLGRVGAQADLQLDELVDATPDSQDVQDLQQTLYGLHALLRLHFAQEEESFFTLAEPRTADPHPAGHAGIASSSTTSPTSGGTRSSGLA